MTNYFFEKMCNGKTIMQSHIITTLKSCKSKHQGFGKRKIKLSMPKCKRIQPSKAPLVAFIAQIYKKKLFFLTLVGHGS
jgi:hypothetical protein